MVRGADSTQPVDLTMFYAVVAFRLIAFVWMAVLVVITLATDSGAKDAIVGGSLTLATLATTATLLVARKRAALKSWRWIAADGVIALLIAIAPYVADAERLFFGGYPISWLVLAVYARELPGGLVSAGFLSTSQILGSALAPRPGDPFSAGQVVSSVATFFAVAVVLGWTVRTLRRSEQLRLEERERRLVAEEREQVASHLHDSVLQTLALVQRRADDSGEVRYLARRQEQELRQWLHQFSSPYDHSFGAAVQALSDGIEDRHRVHVETVAIGDCELDDDLAVMVEAAREALANAAKHSGVDRIFLTSEVGETQFVISVRDRGIGFDTEELAPDRGLAVSIRQRMQRIGGTAEVHSTRGKGTEVKLTLERS